MLKDAKIFLSLLMGICFAGVAFLIVSFIDLDSALFSAVFAFGFTSLFMHIVLTISEKHANKKYSILEKSLELSFFYKTNGNFNLGSGVKNGNIYFCEKRIVFIFVDQKPYLIGELSIFDIDRYEFDQFHMNIYTTDGRNFLIALPDAENVLKQLQEKKWL